MTSTTDCQILGSSNNDTNNDTNTNDTDGLLTLTRNVLQQRRSAEHPKASAGREP